MPPGGYRKEETNIIAVNGGAELGVPEKKKKSENISFNGVAGLNEKEKWKLTVSGMGVASPSEKNKSRRALVEDGKGE